MSRPSRLSSVLVPVVSLALPLALGACEPIYPYEGGHANEVVFGIEQKGGAVSADYEFIGLGGHGGSVAAAFRDGDGDGRCWFEDLDQRLGKPHVDTGFATFSGGTLGTPPGSGLLLQANQAAPTTQGSVGWTSADLLSFYAEGFAMPLLDRVMMQAPLVELAIGAIAPAPDAAGAIALGPSTDVGVTWTPPAEETASRVLVTLETAHTNVRCFDRAVTGSIVVPAKWIALLFPADGSSSSVDGKLTIASHRQTTVIAPGNWLVYVVATAVHRDVAFKGTRE